MPAQSRRFIRAEFLVERGPLCNNAGYYHTLSSFDEASPIDGALRPGHCREFEPRTRWWLFVNVIMDGKDGSAQADALCFWPQHKPTQPRSHLSATTCVSPLPLLGNEAAVAGCLHWHQHLPSSTITAVAAARRAHGHCESTAVAHRDRVHSLRPQPAAGPQVVMHAETGPGSPPESGVCSHPLGPSRWTGAHARAPTDVGSCGCKRICLRVHFMRVANMRRAPLHTPC